MVHIVCLLVGLKTSDLPVIREKGNYESEEDYLNTYFRLLREECFYKLRKGISEFVEYGQASSSKDLTMYRYTNETFVFIKLAHR